MRISGWQKLIIAIIYFLSTAILFFLPGSAFPKETWLDQIHFDKVVHIGLFTVLALAWCWALNLKRQQQLGKLFLLLALYGILVEIVQGLCIPNRSFDLVDWTVDMIGAGVGCWYWKRRVRAKK